MFSCFPQQNISHYQPILVKFCLLSITGSKTNNARQTHHKIYCCHQPYPQSKQFVQSVLRNSPCLSIRGCVPYTGNIICFITHIICTKILFFLPSIFLIAGKIIVSVWQVVSINKIRNKIRSSRHDNIIISRSTQSSIDIIYDGPSTNVSYHTSDTSININLLFPVLARRSSLVQNNVLSASGAIVCCVRCWRQNICKAGPLLNFFEIMKKLP